MDTITTVRAANLQPGDTVVWTDAFSSPFTVTGTSRETDSGLVFAFSSDATFVLHADQLVEVERAPEEP